MHYRKLLRRMDFFLINQNHLSYRLILVALSSGSQCLTMKMFLGGSSNKMKLESICGFCSTTDVLRGSYNFQSETDQKRGSWGGKREYGLIFSRITLAASRFGLL